MPAQKKITKNNNIGINFLGAALGLAVVLLLSAANIMQVGDRPKVIIRADNENEERLAFWKELIKKNPGYYDGYIELAKQEVMMGNEKEAREILAKAEEIFPNSEKIK